MTTSGCKPIAEKLRKMWPFTSATGRSIDLPLHECDDRLVEVERDAEVLGEVVVRAERQHAERLVAAGDDVGDGVDGSVAAAGEDRVELAAARGFLCEGAKSARLDEADIGLRAGGGKTARDLLLRVGHVQPGQRAGAFIQQDDCLHSILAGCP